MVRVPRKIVLFPRLLRQYRAGAPARSILMYFIHTAVLGSGILLRSTSCIHAVVRAVLPYTREKITIFRGTLKAALTASDA